MYKILLSIILCLVAYCILSYFRITYKPWQLESFFTFAGGWFIGECFWCYLGWGIWAE